MSRRPVLLLMLALTTPRVAPAQGTAALDAEVRRLEGAVDSLRRGFGEVSSLAAGTPEVPRATPRHDDLVLVTAGRLQIRTNRSPLPVEQAAAIAWQRMADYFGEMLDSVPLAPLVIEGLDPDSSRGEWDDVAELTLPWDMAADQLATRIVDARAPAVDDPALVDFFGGVPHATSFSRSVQGRAYLDLILSSYSPGRDCILASVDACLPALRLLPEPAPITRVYPTARDRREVAAAIGRGGHAPAIQPLLDRCLTAGEDAGCTAVIEAVTPSVRPAITSGLTRRTLLEFALHTGGPGAYARLLAGRGAPMGDRLASAAALPLDTLLLRWRAELTGAGQVSDPWSFGVLGGGVVWVVALALSAMTSSRWRVD